MARSEFYSISEIENMMPWERQIYITLLSNHIKEENKKLEEMQRSR
tara:strand:+ start:508 stop:645 length:138 start_codon:yes stop_codon:yes gene_type:complete